MMVVAAGLVAMCMVMRLAGLLLGVGSLIWYLLWSSHDEMETTYV